MSGRPRHDFSETLYFLEIQKKNTRTWKDIKGLACRGFLSF